MDRSKAVFWLGDLNRPHKRRAANGQVAEVALMGNKEPLPLSASHHPSGDRKLMDEILRIFDGTLDILDRQEDLQTRVLIDRLALDVMSCVRCYVQTKAKH